MKKTKRRPKLTPIPDPKPGKAPRGRAAQAGAMEQNAELKPVKGLGRNFSWKEFWESKAPDMKGDGGRAD